MARRMDELTQRIVARLREDPGSLSRNRNFLTFEEPAARRALQLVRYLEGLERDILEHGRTAQAAAAPGQPTEIEIRRTTGERQVRIVLVFPLLRGTRTSFLTQQEFDLLLENPEVRRALARKEIA